MQNTNVQHPLPSAPVSGNPGYLQRFGLFLERNCHAKAFIYGLAVSFLLFIPFILVDEGFFLFYGDFNVQQIPFYQMCHDAIRSGNIKWSWTTDLGANFIGSYSFYLLGSPFFWLTLPFPSEAVPYMMGPLLMLKFACASFTASLFLRRYVQSDHSAVLGGLLYAFSGYSVYNIFFNHFHEAIIVFPLLLWGLDEFMENRRRGVFAFMVFLSCFMNYYFFTGQVTFTVIYFFMRICSKSWRISLREFFLLACEAVLGLLLSCALLVPTVLAVIQNPRVDNPPEGWNAILYGWNQRYMHILECFFFPPDIPARPNFTPDSNAKWASLGAWLPLFGMTGVIGFLKRNRGHWLRRLLPTLFFMALVPILNSAFQMFNASYYARWYYMLTLMMVLATLKAIEDHKTEWHSSVRWVLGITLGIALSIGLMWDEHNNDGEITYTFGLEKYPTRFWSYVAISLVSLLLLTIIFRHWKKNRQRFMRQAILGTAVISLLYGTFFIALGKTQSNSTRKHLIPYCLNSADNISLPEDTSENEVYRIDIYDGMDNQAMYWQMPTIQAFHSIVPGSIMEFYPTIGVTRDVGSRPDTTTYGLRGLTSCRYLFDPTSSGDRFGGETGNDAELPGWTYMDHQNGFDIWENQYYIPMGFSYDHYVTEAEYEECPQVQRHLLLLKAMVLTDEQIAEYSPLLEHLPVSGTDATTLNPVSYSEDAYYQDCIERRSMSCSAFTRDNDGFTAVFESEKERLLFFSVPYESGWSATVNGEPAEILKVSVGFMAVKVPAGKNTIRFDYKTPGLTAGILITLGSAAILALYLFLTKKFDARRKEKAALKAPAGQSKNPYAYKIKNPELLLEFKRRAGK